MSSQNKLLDMPIWKSLLFLSFPVIITNLLQIVYNYVGLYWVGKLGESAITILTLNGTVLFLIFSCGLGFSIAGSILVAQYFGARKFDDLNKIVAQILLMIALIGGILIILGQVFLPYLVQFLGPSEDIIQQTTTFLRVTLLCVIFTFIFAMFQGIMRGIGKASIPIYISAFAILLNAILAPIFIYGIGSYQGMGLMGASVVMLICQIVTVAISMIILIKGVGEVKLVWKNFKLNAHIIKKSFWLGLPSSIELLVIGLSAFFLIKIISLFGNSAIASFGLSANIQQFVVLFAMGISMATSVLIGQSVGAGRIKRAKQILLTSTLSGFILLFFLGFIAFIFSRDIIGFFAPNDPKIIDLGAQLIHIAWIGYGIMGANFCFDGVLRGVGKTQIPMVVTLITQMLVLLPVGYMVSRYFGFGFISIMYSWLACVILTFFMLLFFILRIDWQKANITKD